MSESFDFSEHIKGIRKNDPDYYSDLTESNEYYNDDYDHKDKKKFRVHEGIIFLVEITNSLLSPYETANGGVGGPPMLDIFDSLSATIEQLTITLPNTGIGLYIFNSSKPDPDSAMKMIFPLRDINIEDMKLVDEYKEAISSNKIDLIKEWSPLNQDFVVNDEDTADGDTGSSSLIKVLSEIQFNFKKENLIENREFNKRKVFFFTDNDNPKNVDAARCRIVLNDLKTNGIEFNPFLISAGKKVFDPSKFYDEIARKLGHGVLLNVQSIKTNLLKEKVLRTKEIERKLFFCPLYLNESISIGVSGFLTFQQENPVARSRMYHAIEKTDAVSKRQYLSESTGEDITKSITPCYELINKKFAKVEDGERFKVQNDPSLMDPFLKIIGFAKNKEIFSYLVNVEKPYFIIPDETELKGSTKAFTALYKSLFKQQKSCLLIGKIRKANTIQNYLMTVNGTNGTGIYLYRIPSKEEIRLFPPINEELCEALDDGDSDTNEDYRKMYNVASFLLKRVTMKNAYNPKDYRNPYVQKFYKVLRIFLLQVEVPEDDENNDTDLDDTVEGLKRTFNVFQTSKECQEKLKEWLAIYEKYGVKSISPPASSSQKNHTKRKK
ncbi:hypothetical protein ACO0QE_003793 [Hanseniaspora vineae]